MVDYLDTFLRPDDSEELRLRLVKLEKDGYTRGFAEGESYAVIGLAGAERKTIVARLRARATTEDLTADRRQGVERWQVETNTNAVFSKRSPSFSPRTTISDATRISSKVPTTNVGTQRAMNSSRSSTVEEVARAELAISCVRLR